jgi:hypothetical protein
MAFRDRLAHAWDAFTGEDRNRIQAQTSFGYTYGSTRPDRVRLNLGDRSIVSSIYNRIGIDASGIDINHVRVNDDGQYIATIDSGLNNCLTLEANIDQGARAFRQDMVMSLFDKGVIAIVPVETTIDPESSSAFDVKTLRVGEITAWFPGHVRVLVYNQATGRKEEITLAKDYVAIVENPLFSVMNEQNGTLQRLIRKLGYLDSVDEQASSGKLDMIIQLPYVIKTEARQQQAEARRKDIEMQLKGSQYGIAYTDGTEKITQLNRPVENNMLKQVEYLTNMLYAQLGLTPEVFNGTASEAVMLNYYNRTIDPILQAITEGMKRTFLSKTARSQKQSIQYFRDPFKLVPVGTIAEIADKFARNEIMSSNEIRAKIGLKPSSDPKADKLLNSNMPQAAVAPQASVDVGTLKATPVPPKAPLELESPVIDQALAQADPKVQNHLATFGITPIRRKRRES